MLHRFMSLPKLTIGFLRRGYSSTGGVEAYLKGLAVGLIGEGHRVFLLGTKEWPACEGRVRPFSMFYGVRQSDENT